jgi:hypothetical protein
LKRLLALLGASLAVLACGDVQTGDPVAATAVGSGGSGAASGGGGMWDPPATPETIADAPGAHSLRLVDEHLYLITDHAVARVHRDGGALEMLSASDPQLWLHSIVDGFVYGGRWTDGDVVRVPVAGGPLQTLVVGAAPDSQSSMVPSADALFLAIPDAGTIERVDFDDLERTVVLDNVVSPDGLVIFEADLYFTTSEDGTLWRVPVAGGAPEELGQLGENNSRLILLEGSTAWWNSGGWGSFASIGTVELTTGDSRVLVTGHDFFDSFALGDRMYWSGGSDSAIRRADRAGGDVDIVAVAAETYYSVSVTVDDDYLYWTDAGSIVRRALP